MLIACTGQKRSGKDSVALTFAARGFERVSFAGTLKGMIKYLLMSGGMSANAAEDHINGDLKEVELAILQGKTTRFAMQTLGTEWRNFFGENLWSDIVEAKVQITEDVILTDMRFLHEELFVDSYQGWKIRVVRAGQPPVPAGAHASEKEMEAITPDITIFNHGSLDDLNVAAAFVATSVLGV